MKGRKTIEVAKATDVVGFDKFVEENQILEVISGYSNGFITDEECIEMCDLILNEITTIKK